MKDCRTGGAHRFEDITTIESVERVQLCVYCSAENREQLFNIPIRVDSTLCDPGEVWLEGQDCKVVKVFP